MTITEDMIFRIAGVGIQIKMKRDWVYGRRGRFSDFLSVEPPHAIFKIKVGPLPVEPSGPPVFDTGIGWRLYQVRDRWVVWVESQGHNPYLAGSFSPDYHSGEIFVSESDQEPGKFIFPLSYPLGELLMTNLLATGYGIMLHSCGVIDGEIGIAFAGVSTAGKTTTANLWEGLPSARVLSDDHTVLRKMDGEFRVYGTPWHSRGGYALAQDAPLKKIFILKHATSNQAVRLPPAQAAAALLVRMFAPLWSAAGMAFSLNFLEELCQTVPCYELGFVPDQSAVEYVRCLSID